MHLYTFKLRVKTRLAPKVIFLRKSQVKSPKSQDMNLNFLKKFLELLNLTIRNCSKKCFQTQRSPVRNLWTLCKHCKLLQTFANALWMTRIQTCSESHFFKSSHPKVKSLLWLFLKDVLKTHLDAFSKFQSTILLILYTFDKLLGC